MTTEKTDPWDGPWPNNPDAVTPPWLRFLAGRLRENALDHEKRGEDSQALWARNAADDLTAASAKWQAANDENKRLRAFLIRIANELHIAGAEQQAVEIRKGLAQDDASAAVSLTAAGLRVVPVEQA